MSDGIEKTYHENYVDPGGFAFGGEPFEDVVLPAGPEHVFVWGGGAGFGG